MGQHLAIGLGAGLVSALLFSVVITGSPLAIVLSYAAPLPILIAALGWNHRSGLLAVCTGAIAVSLVLRPTTGLAYALGSGFPAWWIAFLVLLGRPVVAPGGLQAANAPVAMEWFPLGHLLAWIAGTATLVVLVGAIALGNGHYGDYSALLTRLLDNFLQTDLGSSGGTTAPAEGAGGTQFRHLILKFVPMIVAAIFCLFFVVNAWLGAKAVQISGRLVRPWPMLFTARMPLLAVALLVGGLLAAFMPGYVGVGGTALAGAMAMAFALQGLALLHHVTMGRPGRLGILVCTYILTLFFGGTFLPLMAVAGVVDTTTPLRRRLTLTSGGAGLT